MATTAPPISYSTIGYKEIAILHVPANATNATKVLVIAFNRPEKINAAAYHFFDRDERVRDIVLTGAGKYFCVGADLSSRLHTTHVRCRGGRVAVAISNCTKPTIVALNGSVAGFGLTVSLSACIRVAWTDARVSMPFARHGLTMESCSAFYLPRLLGFLFSKLLPAPQGTASYAVELATNIAENTSLTSTKLMRDMMLHCPETPEETHVLDSRVVVSVVGSDENTEGLRSYMEKIKPAFSGTAHTADTPDMLRRKTGSGLLATM
ncbi:ClpP/crotonase-like domain-containing protein [Dactylonectria estremocensis]|uniref:ClpP/crotonase-like domain-containing protein n=1 Tax=Dactylonectria estremocensis TaxID=1079267 RepID=A0A9P9EN30_9HYPO|nr:ClpP/crotonase-like domain-containing protein [Dactylonectria estremocensis]